MQVDQQYQSDDDDNDAPQLAFPITKKLPPRDGPPTTAEEYISLIRQESNKLPSVLSAPRTNPPINTSPPKKSRKSPCPSLLTEVSSAELHRLANQFADLQQSFLQMCRRKDLPQKAFSPQQLLKMQPLVSIVMQVDHVSSVAALKFITESLPQQEEREHKERNVESMSKLASALVADRHRATWMFCLLLVLEMPISADVAATMRCLLHRVYASHHGLRGTDDERLPGLNLFAAILGIHFGQEESW